MGTETLEEKLFKDVHAQVQPGASLKHIKPDLDRIEPSFFKLYDGKPVGDAKLEDAFNSVAKSYVTALYDLVGKNQPNVDGPEWYGNLIRDWLGKVGPEAMGQVRAAIKQGNRAEVLRLINQGYEAQANKLQSTISKIQGQSSDVQMGVYTLIANTLAGGKGGDVAKVATNVPAAVQALGQYSGITDAYQKKVPESQMDKAA